MSDPKKHGRIVPVVDILLLGSPGVGKSTFLSRLQYTRNGSLDLSSPLPSRVLTPSSPQSFDVTLYNRPYQFQIYTSTSTLFIDPFPGNPSFVIIAYSIPDRESLHNAQYYWRKQLSLHYDYIEGDIPIMLLGLKRDLRTDKQTPKDLVTPYGDQVPEFQCVMPEEGLRVAQEMRCDRYAECSALTGELMWQVLEDITRTAAMTTTEKGGLSEGPGCTIM